MPLNVVQFALRALEGNSRKVVNMLQGHREAQNRFLALGERHGFSTRRSYSTHFPSDGVWLTRSAHGDQLGDLPVVAIEVVVSESPKMILGSIAVLERIGASLGVILVHEDEIARRLIRDGCSRGELADYLQRTQVFIDLHIASSRHRLQRWSNQYMQYLYNNSMAA